MANLPEPIKEEEEEDESKNIAKPQPQKTTRSVRLQSARRASIAVFTSQTPKSTNQQRSPEIAPQSHLVSKPNGTGRRMSLAAQAPRRRASVVTAGGRRASVTWNMTSQIGGNLTPRHERVRKQSVTQIGRTFQPIVRRKKTNP